MSNYIPGTATTLSGMDATAIRRIAYSSRVKQDQVLPSVWTSIPTKFEVLGGEMVIMDHGVCIDVTNEGKRAVGGGQSVVMTLSTNLKKAPQEGTSEDMLGNGDEFEYLYLTAYYNEVKKAVKFNQWGYDFNDTEHLGHVKAYGKKLMTFWQEHNSLRYEQAAWLGFSPELTKAPTSQTQTLNPNWAIPGLATSSYPTWDVDTITETDGSQDSNNWYPDRYYSGNGTFIENLAAAMLSGSGVTATPTATPTIDNLLEMINWMDENIVVEPISLDGNKQTRIFKVTSSVYNWMMNPNNSGSIMEYWEATAAYADKRPYIPGEMGRLFGNYVVVKDMRAPTLTVAGSVGSYTITFGWQFPGGTTNDQRNRTAWSATSGSENYVFHGCMFIGAEALCRYTRDGYTDDMYEQTEFGKRRERGSYLGEGIVLAKYDKGTPTATTKIYRGSCCAPFAIKQIRSS